jgi:hypothetical protein
VLLDFVTDKTTKRRGESVQNCTTGRLNFILTKRGASLSREIALQNGNPSLWYFFEKIPCAELSRTSTRPRR